MNVGKMVFHLVLSEMRRFLIEYLLKYKCVVLKNVSVRIHIVQTITGVPDQIVFDVRVIGEREIYAVARIADLVSADQNSFTIPLMNSVAAAVRNERGVAIFRALANAFFHRLF